MLKVIIEKEIREILGSSKFVYTFFVCTVLILISFYSGAINYNMSVSRWEVAKSENLRSFEGVTEWYRVKENKIFLPPQPLATLVSGVSNDIGRSTMVGPSGEITPQDSRYNEEPIYAYFRFMDLQFIFQIVLALFAILLGYDAICGEKERGTLKLCLSNSVPRSKFLLGKFIGSFSLLSTSLLFALGLGCLILPLLGVHLQGEEWIRLVLIILTGLLYFGTFLAISFLVSALSQKSSSSFLILLIVWIGSVLIVPRAAVLLAGRAVEVPTVDQIGYEKASFATEQWKSFIAAMGNYESIQSEDMEEVMNAFSKFSDSLSESREEKMNEFRSRLNENRRNREKERSKIALSLARVSPSASMSLATLTLAGTSPDLKDRFYDQAKNYQTALSNFLFEKTGMNMGRGMVMIYSDGEDQRKATPINANEIPVFTFENEPLKASLASALPDMGLLLLFNFFFLLGAFKFFNKYDAR